MVDRLPVLLPTQPYQPEVLKQLLEGLAEAPAERRETVEALLMRLTQDWVATAPAARGNTPAATLVANPVVDAVLNGLSHPALSVRSACAMVAIRLGGMLGDEMTQALRAFYKAHGHQPHVYWVVAQIFDALSECL
jgi:hypothetical protein